MLRVAVLASGRGSNLEALLEASRQGNAGYRIVGVFSDKPQAGALDIARAAGIPAVALAATKGEDRAKHDAAFFARVRQVQPDLIVCAGYMRIISADALAHLTIPMINIHPSLLPRYPGLHTHARVLEAGDTEHGSSVHVVTAELDAGPLLAQTRIDVRHDDTPDTLAARVLTQEHRLLPACVRAIASRRLSVTGSAPLFDGVPLTAPLRLLESTGELTR
ncbi:phosphoribosylglycinamide formyltransferase [Xanthomonadaceae bacterium JHOS43]|nr:phosphoribosylglycinamide formyltransferase [Xanthomonadaceae bacterium JHOS43]